MVGRNWNEDLETIMNYQLTFFKNKPEQEYYDVSMKTDIGWEGIGIVEKVSVSFWEASNKDGEVFKGRTRKEAAAKLLSKE